MYTSIKLASPNECQWDGIYTREPVTEGVFEFQSQAKQVKIVHSGVLSCWLCLCILFWLFIDCPLSLMWLTTIAALFSIGACVCTHAHLCFSDPCLQRLFAVSAMVCSFFCLKKSCAPFYKCQLSFIPWQGKILFIKPGQSTHHNYCGKFVRVSF